MRGIAHAAHVCVVCVVCVCVCEFNHFVEAE